MGSVQMGGLRSSDPPKSLARYMTFAKLHSRILSVEAVQAAKTTWRHAPEQHATMLSAGGLGTGSCWTAMHKSQTELAQNFEWRMANGVATRCNTRCRPALLVCSAERQ